MPASADTLSLTDRLVQRFEDEARHRGRPPRTIDDHNLLKAFARLAVDEALHEPSADLPPDVAEFRGQFNLVVTGVLHSLQLLQGPGTFLSATQRSRGRAFCAELAIAARAAGRLFEEPKGETT